MRYYEILAALTLAVFTLDVISLDTAVILFAISLGMLIGDVKSGSYWS